MDYHLDIQRKNSFESIANLYDRFRPGCSEGLYKFLAQELNLNPSSKVLEVGCGSGQASLDLMCIGRPLF